MVNESFYKEFDISDILTAGTGSTVEQCQNSSIYYVKMLK